jgi:hypothetical protein
MDDLVKPVTIEVDLTTARLLRDVLYAQGEHQSAGAPLPILDADDSKLLGAFLRDLDIQLGGTGRLA